MRKVVVNTTPLIALADIGHLDLLQKLYHEIMIPEAVLEEIKSEPACTLVKSSEWIKVFQIVSDEEKNMYRARLHSGEIEVMNHGDGVEGSFL